MVNINDARIASYEDKGQKFEIMVDPDMALEISQGNKDLANNMSKLMATDEVYKNAKSGDLVSEKVLQEHFGTTDLVKIVEVILKRGHLDLTTEQKRKLAEMKRKEVIAYIVRNSTNPVTKAPHTYTRVESSLETAKIQIDTQRPIDQQIERIIEKLTEILPMEFKTVIFKATIPIQFAGKVNSIINKYEIQDRKWESTAFIFSAKVPAGEKDAFMNTISGLTKGQAQFDIQ